MKYFAILLLIASFAVLSESEYVNLAIKEADKTLKKNGWNPMPLNCEYEEDKQSYWSLNAAPEIFKSGISSIHSCTGTGQNYCKYFYSNNNGKCLSLVTIGEFSDKKLDSLIVKSVGDYCPEDC